ncbi:MAG: aldose 1-epimerase [Solirubrobacteraceae bacterium]
MTFETITVTSSGATSVAEFVPGAAMLCCSWRARGDELLDPGNGVEAYAAQGKTMAIPLLYPWANRLAGYGYSAAGRQVTLPEDPARIAPDPNGLPIHGIVPGLIRFAPQPPERDDQLLATLAWNAKELLELYPFEHEVRLSVTAQDDALTIAVTVRATGSEPVPVSFGFHPYVRIPGSNRTTWRLELPPADHLQLDDKMIPTGEHEPAPDGEVALADSSWDDAYRPHEQPARYAVSDDRHRIELTFDEGFPFSQIYAPPGKDFICFEPMTAPTNALASGDQLPVVDPGSEYRAAFSLRYRNKGVE